MAPGYRSPFNHPSPKTNHNTDPMLPCLAILLCVSVILGLALSTFCAAAKHSRHEQNQPKDDAPVPSPEMALDQASTPNYLAMRSSKDPRRATNIRDLFLRDESPVDEGGHAQQPLLRTETYSGPLGEDSCVVEMATRRDGNVHKKGSINWHGTNTLNTSWGWMA